VAKSYTNFAMSPHLRELESERKWTVFKVIFFSVVPVCVQLISLRYFFIAQGEMVILGVVFASMIFIVAGMFYSLGMVRSFKKKLRQRVLVPLVNESFPDADTTSGKSYHSIDSFFKAKLLMSDRQFSVSNFEENGITHIFHGDLGSVQYSDLEVSSGHGRNRMVHFDGMVAYYKAPLTGLGSARFEAPPRNWQVFPWKMLFWSIFLTSAFMAALEYIGFSEYSTLGSRWTLRALCLLPLLFVLITSIVTYMRRRKIESHINKGRYGLWWTDETFQNNNTNLKVIAQPIYQLYKKHKQVVVCSMTDWGIYISFPTMTNFMNISLLRSLTSGRQQRVWDKQLEMVKDISEVIFKTLGSLKGAGGTLLGASMGEAHQLEAQRDDSIDEPELLNEKSIGEKEFPEANSQEALVEKLPPSEE